MNKIQRLARVNIVLLIFLLITNKVFADISLEEKKVQAISALESAFTPTFSQTTTVSISNQIELPQLGVNLDISNQALMTIRSKSQIKVTKISVTMNGVTTSDMVNLEVKPNSSVKYQLNIADFIKNNNLLNNYKLLGIVKKVAADDYPGYQDYYYFIINITLDWQNNSNYNQATTKFMLVGGK